MSKEVEVTRLTVAKMKPSERAPTRERPAQPGDRIENTVLKRRKAATHLLGSTVP